MLLYLPLGIGIVYYATVKIYKKAKKSESL